MIESAEKSLARLKRDRIDLFQLHNWDEETPLEETMAGLHALVESGKVRCIGCSNWQASLLSKSLLLCQAAGMQRMQSVQPLYNLVQREIESDLLPLCADLQIGVVTYSPLTAGFLTGKYGRGQKVPVDTRYGIIAGHQPIYFTDHGYAVLERLKSAAKETEQSMVQLAMGWVLTRPNTTSVLIGARNTD